MSAALYAVLIGQTSSSAGTQSLVPESMTVMQQAPIELAAPLESVLPEQQRTGTTSALQILPSLTELKGLPAQQITSTAESRVEQLNHALRTTPTPTLTATPTGPACEPGPYAAYCVYTVQEGDTLSSIALQFALKSEHLPGWELLVASNKPDIVSADDFIQPGQMLRVPTQPGIVHAVFMDETVGDLADQFDVTSASIISANGITDSNLIGIGQVLLIPDPKRIPSPEELAAAAEPEPSDDDREDGRNDSNDGDEGASEPRRDDPTAEPTEAPAAPTPEPVDGFIWPITASKRITNYFSARHPLGIDLGLGHDPGSPVVAVAPGKVVFAGGDACCSYGYYVIVDHENGLKTLYAHLRTIQVSVGQYVSQGQTLGPSGTTGYSTGVHLHFEVHRNGTRVDPMMYLP